MSQFHSKFKVFISTPGPDGLLNQDLLATIAKLATESKLAIKSISVEFVDGQVIVALGYADDQPSYPVQVQCVSLGRLGRDDVVIADAMALAASQVNDLLCHEFYVDDSDDHIMVLLSKLPE
jgi:hypothetical protein